MNNNCLDKLEYFKILEKLNSFAKTYAGKKLVNNLTPSFPSSPEPQSTAFLPDSVNVVPIFAITIFQVYKDKDNKKKMP